MQLTVRGFAERSHDGCCRQEQSTAATRAGGRAHACVGIDSHDVRVFVFVEVIW